MVHLIHFDYLRRISPAFPRADILVEAMRQRDWPVTIWCRKLENSKTGKGQYGEVVIPVTDPIGFAKTMANEALNFFRLCKARSNPASDSKPADRLKGPRGHIQHKILVFLHRILFPDLERLWSQAVARRLIPIIKPADLIFTCSRPESVGYIGEAATSKGAKWWLDFADGWTIEGIRHGAFPPSSRRLSKETLLESKWLGQANGISTVNQSLALSLSELIPNKPIHVFAHATPKELLGAHGCHVKNLGRSNEITVLYFGRIRRSVATQTLAPLIRNLNTLKQGYPKPRFLFVGEFTAEDLHEFALITKKGVKVEIREPISRALLPKLVQQEGVRAMLVVNPPNNTASTSKIYDALALGMPIWLYAIPKAHSYQLVKATGKGLAIDPESQMEPLGPLMKKLIDDSKAAIQIPAECNIKYQTDAICQKLENLMR